MKFKSYAVSFQECCDRLGFTKRHGERLLAIGRFPIPELKRTFEGRGSPHRFSSVDLDRYFDQASTADVRRRA